MKKKRILETAAVILMTFLLLAWGKEAGEYTEENLKEGMSKVVAEISGTAGIEAVSDLKSIEWPVLDRLTIYENTELEIGGYTTGDGRYVSIHPDQGYEIEELTAEIKDAFLKKHGIVGEAPFYTYYIGDELNLELWFDEEEESGVGLTYLYGYPPTELWPDGNRILGFVFYQVENPDEWQENIAPYDLEYELGVVQDWITRGDIWDYEETKEYNEDGRLTLFLVTGGINFYPDETEPQDVLRAEYTYGEDGKLVSRFFYRNQRIFGTGECSKSSLYDEKEREVYCSAYVTHGSFAWYNLYEGDDDMPSYVLGLDYFGMPYPVFYILKDKGGNQ